MVTETTPSFLGHDTARELAEAGISVTLISDASVFALMSRVNKVIIGVHSVMANGGVIGYSGAAGICMAAHAHSVPVLVISGIYKLSPLYPFDHGAFNETLSPNSILP